MQGTDLAGVAATTTGSAWAVGSYEDFSAGKYRGEQALVLRWDGSRWALARRSGPGTDSNLLATAIGPADSGWGVGWFIKSHRIRAFAIHF